MKRLLSTYLRPYRRQIVVVVALLLIQATLNLYLPTLNADIINDGVAKGDTHEIMRIGALMLGVTLLLGAAAIVA
ncbi:MAG: ABC transporter ATP-binding protein, partial [Solirubrobacterales bacterium]